MRPGRLWIGATFLVLVVACGDDEAQPYHPPAPPRDPLDCVVPLPATDYDGTPWPSYSEKLADFESCQDGDGSLQSVTESECSDGKTKLGTGVGLTGATYFYQGEMLVGLWSWTDLVFIDENGCDSSAPAGTRESVTCDVVSSKAVHCGGEIVDLACEPGSFRCEGNALQGCFDGKGWVVIQVCASAALCQSFPAVSCTDPVCAPGQTRCDGPQREQCSADRTGWDLIEGCVTAARCTPAACL